MDHTGMDPTGMGRIERISEQTVDAAAALALALWPDNDYETLRDEMASMIRSATNALLLYITDGRPVAFAHFALRTDYVEGADSSPTAYLEGIYVQPGYRRQGIARALLAEGERWARAQGCRQLGSDSGLDNEGSRLFHEKAGFREANRIVCFIKEL